MTRRQFINPLYWLRKLIPQPNRFEHPVTIKTNEPEVFYPDPEELADLKMEDADEDGSILLYDAPTPEQRRNSYCAGFNLDPYQTESSDPNVVAEFESVDKFWMKGRGKVLTVVNDKDRPRRRNGLTGEKVKIDEIVYRCKGVESYLIPTIRKGDLIGLLVEEITEDEADNQGK